MEREQAPSPPNLDYVEELYQRYRADPASVEPGWRSYFSSWPEPAPAGTPANGHSAARAAVPAAGGDPAFQQRVDLLVQAYRERGHLQADLDPLDPGRATHEHIGLAGAGLSESDLDRPVATADGVTTLRDLQGRLRETYCRKLGVELAHLHDGELRRWLEARMERTRNRIGLLPEVQRFLLDRITRAETFEQFLGTRFLGAKRFSLEGAEGLVALLELVLDRAAGHGVRDVTIGMAHRGRLNVLAQVLAKPLARIFAEFRDQAIIAGPAGDVKYHLGHETLRPTADGAGLRLLLAFNPSHLEWVNTVVQGKARARQDRRGDRDRGSGLPIVIHGDAAFAGQGIVAEQLNLSQLDGYQVGGTLHVVVNNQVGFTTSPHEARSTLYATDVARMLQIPVFHVNGEDVEAIAQAVLLSLDFRQRFRTDAVIDLWCYRRHGHNEGDEPGFTQPLMVKAIAGRRTLRRLEAERLAALGVVAPAEAEEMVAAARRDLERAYAESAALAATPEPPVLEGEKVRYRGGAVSRLPEPETGVALARLAEVGRSLSQVPPAFHLHPKARRILDLRAEMAAGNRPLDWGMAEALALATLALEGRRVRLSGQDSRRGTFSHRHAVLFDQETGAPYAPLHHLAEGQAPVEVRDSPLSEAGVLGFEYGYSLEAPDGLTIWEAQFGDFVNAAQVVLDQFLASSEAKWGRLSGLVLLLPHGMEGQGPEHSSARLERFLDLAVDDNWFVANLTTPAQIFHALRRQVLAPWRKPLVVMSPKSLLRHPEAVSPLSALATGRFQKVLPDPAAEPAAVRRVVLSSGKLFYELSAARAARQVRHAALLRLEQLYPFPAAELSAELARYPAATELCWAQEEPANMGARRHLELHLPPLLGSRAASFVSRPASASPASGSATRHKLEQESLVAEALGPAPAVARAG
ncbi:MAG: 2-oxoglutarate dehydrogenase E1 component [Deltaproteobacteria bacterium]|nr:2-oxoglutarate dehydrogenase E1 component [Deltaproteobacteria bacterium]